MINKTHPIAEKLLKKGLSLNLNLLDLLSKEADILKHLTNPVKLSTLVHSKKEIVSQIDEFSKQMSQVLSTEKLQMTPSGVSDYFKKAETVHLNTSNSNADWQSILAIAKQCDLLNENNGARINLLMHHNQRSLHILQGKSHQPTTYGADGSTQRELFSHTLFSV